MKRETAEKLKELMERITREVDDSIRYVMENEPQEEFFRYRKLAGMPLGYIYLDILQPIYDEYPDLTPPGLRKE